MKRNKLLKDDMEETKVHITKCKKSIWKGYSHPTAWFQPYDILEKSKTMEREKKISGFQELVWGGER